MSHSIIITLSHVQPIIDSCDSSYDQLNDLSKFDWDKSTLNKIQLIKEELNNIKSKAISHVGNIEPNPFTIGTILSTLLKEISNLKLSLDLKKMYDNYSKISTLNLDEYILQYGILAFETYDYLIKENIEINKNNFSKTLEIIRAKDAENKRLLKYQEIFINQIKESSFIDDIKLSMIKFVTKFKNLQEISDIAPFIYSKNLEYESMKNYMKDVFSILNDLNFKKIGKVSFNFSDRQIFEAKCKFINGDNNTIVIHFNSNNEIKYKLGNYVGHACEKTTNLLLEKLKKKGYIYSSPIIRREISSDPPLFKTAKEMEK